MQSRSAVDASMPLLEHLKALRKTFVFSAYAIVLGTLIGWVLSGRTFAYLAKPIQKLTNVSLITLTPTEPVLVKLKVSLLVGVIISLPFVVWQLWSFILPALKKNERKYFNTIVPLSTFFFLAGAGFAYYFILPVGVKFLLSVGGAYQSTPFVTQTSYLNFVMTLCLAMGLMFQLPIILLLLISTKLVTPKTLAKKRRWAVFAAVVLSAVISPTPDLSTQFLMALPIYVLYEASIWLGFLVIRKKERETMLRSREV